jgi:tetratricopeptide (TPR) repeat protein
LVAFKRIAVASVLLFSGSAASLLQAAELQAVGAVLARTDGEFTASAAPAGKSDAGRLLQDITEFRATGTRMAPAQAATRWLWLWDRASAGDLRPTTYDAFDTLLNEQVGPRSVLAALPAPEAWPEIRKYAEARVATTPNDPAAIGLKLIADVLMHDRAASLQSLQSFERVAKAGVPAERETRLMQIDATRSTVYRLYGNRDQIAEQFRATVDARSRRSYTSRVEVPDLVGLVGPVKAESLLKEALRKPVTLNVPEGEATRELARRVALAEVASLRKPQWALIDALGTNRLYEALSKRFDSPAKKGSKDAAADDEFDFERRQADVFYFLDMVLAGRQAEAEAAMDRAAGAQGNSLYMPRRAMEELVKKGENRAVYTFLGRLLQRRPQLPAWDFYLQQAAYLGRSAEGLALIDGALKRSDLPPFMKDDLQRRRIDALLAADQVDEAEAGLRELLAAAPTAGESGLEERTGAAIRAAALGRVLKRPALARLGIDFSHKVVALPPAPQTQRWRTEKVRALLAELRRQGLDADAQQVALAELAPERMDPRMKGYEVVAVDPARRAALIELAGLYDAAGRRADVLQMLDGIGIWGVSDLAGLVTEKDSLGTPFGMMAARALTEAGRTEAAKASLKLLIDRLPGHDPAYQLWVSSEAGAALAELDRRAAADPFEERPLIWKAVVLKSLGRLDEAESAVRLAIATDPSDGEQGTNDRMRAYAVLADVLEAKGDATAAQTFRNAVSAIRISEKADELHKLGLYKRAFAEYRTALDQFADAYCIQSRLAVQLARQGFHDEAAKHYRRAFELMPDSFGRVESHCFGCENIFAGPAAQAVAEQVFTQTIKDSSRPQAAYMLGYLRKEQGRYDEAVQLFRQSVRQDPQYLNAWRHLHELARKTYIDPVERDLARLKLFQLDPQQRHVRYDLSEVADIERLWRAVERVRAEHPAPMAAPAVYPLVKSAGDRKRYLDKLPGEMQTQMVQYIALQERVAVSDPAVQLASHSLLNQTLQLIKPAADFSED